MHGDVFRITFSRLLAVLAFVRVEEREKVALSIEFDISVIIIFFCF